MKIFVNVVSERMVKSVVNAIDMVSVQNLLAPSVVSWKTLYGTFPAWQSWQAVLNFSHIFKIKKNYKKFYRTAISWHLQKQVGMIVCITY